ANRSDDNRDGRHAEYWLTMRRRILREPATGDHVITERQPCRIVISAQLSKITGGNSTVGIGVACDRSEKFLLISLEIWLSLQNPDAQRLIVVRLHRDHTAPREVEQGRVELDILHASGGERARQSWSQLVRWIELLAFRRFWRLLAPRTAHNQHDE